MDEREPIAEAAVIGGSAGFLVSRNGDDVEIRIEAPTRAAVVSFAWIRSLLVLFPSFGLLILMARIVPLRSDDFDLCGMTFTMLLTFMCLWQTIAAVRRIGRARQVRAHTTIGIARGVLWCAPASENGAPYHWSTADIWRLNIEDGWFWRSVWLQVRSRRRAVGRVRIPVRTKIALRLLLNILNHAIGSTVPHPILISSMDERKSGDCIGEHSPVQMVTDPDQQEIQYAHGQYTHSELLGDWVSIASYWRFADWRLAHLTLSTMNIPTRMDPPSPAAHWQCVLSVPRSQEQLAREWLRRPHEWFDQTHCPRCGGRGETVGFCTRVVRTLRNSDEPPTLSNDWRFCSECKKAYLISD